MCALRSPKMSMPNHFEFPGGKIEKNESYKEAIEREIREELNCSVEFNSIFNENVYDYGDFTVSLTAVKCALISGFISLISV